MDPFCLLSPFLSPTFPPGPKDQILAISSKVGLLGAFYLGNEKHGAVRSDLTSLKFFFSGSFLAPARGP